MMNDEQVYYSIDKEPGICAQLIAQGIRTGRVTRGKPELWMKWGSGEKIRLDEQSFFGGWPSTTSTGFTHVPPTGREKTFDEIVQELTDMISDAWEKVIFGHFTR